MTKSKKKLTNKNIRVTWNIGVRESASDLTNMNLMRFYYHCNLKIPVIGYKLQFWICFKLSCRVIRCILKLLAPL